LLNARDGVARATARVRPSTIDHRATAKRLHRGVARTARRLVDLALGHPTSSLAIPVHGLPWPEARRTLIQTRRRAVARRHLILRLASERTVPLAVALIVLVTGVVTLGPSFVRPVGAAQGGSQPVRLAIGGGVSGAQYDATELAGLLGLEGTSSGLGDSVDDGSLYKPVAVDTSIESASDLLRHYTVKTGDSLTGIASKYGVSMMTIWWANHLSSKDQLHVGQTLVIPPVNGLVVTVAVGDTLDSLAAKYKTTSDAILTANELTDPNLIVGEVLMMPGAKGAPIPTPKITVASGSGGHGSFTYTGGAWHWPVVGGGNYISQYYWSGHLGVDIAGQYGTPIVAPLAGRVVYAGWKSNGGGYQVWLNLGNGLYTGMYHMSAVVVHVGQVVARGQMVGRIGTSGWATGPHCHFEVWVGYPWESSSYRVNPLRYY
jgi:murein DD-endopeptidase MepM/ murein hydrolase activator NlpD